MNSENEMKATISGSFAKFKPEIDSFIDEFSDMGVTVLQPEKGWVYKPAHRLIDLTTFRPLRGEAGMSIREIEDSFLEAISKSDFVFVVNPEGFIGESVAFEIGYAVGSNIPIFSLNPILCDIQNDPAWIEYAEYIKCFSPSDIVNEINHLKTGSETNPLI